ncbi:glycosyltransferase, partial [Frankia sp. CNm7]|uniref:glycosyltransferase family 4 protein n=1 Tax=Frankia nepalensis TaxID=1836974 RepID=UPI0019341F96
SPSSPRCPPRPRKAASRRAGRPGGGGGPRGGAPGGGATLLAAGARAGRPPETRPTSGQRAQPGLARPAQTLLTVLRLDGAEWADRGMPALLAALPAVRDAVGPVRLVIAGRGPATAAPRRAAAAIAGVELVESPDDATLAGLYATADLFVLAARTRPGQAAEDYGLLLTEAQLAGCPVVGPVSGGARDTYVDGVTGVTPGDESPEALAAVLVDLLTDRARLARMRRRAAEWARMATEPAEHTRAVFTAVLGTAPVQPAVAEVLPGRSAAGPHAAATQPTMTAPTVPRPVVTGPAVTGPGAPGPAQARPVTPLPRRPAARVWPARDEDLAFGSDDAASEEGVVDDLADGGEADRDWRGGVETDDLADR